jgi:hypothetical protein
MNDMTDEIQAFTNTISFCAEISNQIFIVDKRKFDEINGFSNSFMNVYNLERSKLPYHINILDLIWANENAHSRIFAELIKQNNESKFDVLESFFQYLNKINPNFNLVSQKPSITSEKDRIDLMILDTNYALIIENKIHNAADQTGQLARYINKVKEKYSKENQIYVLYLTRDGGKPMPEQSWVFGGISYKEGFVNRFIPISFRDNILPWLKDYVLPDCRIKDVYLKSTIEQYIDYLEGMFNLRKIDKEMNNELENHIVKELGLTSTLEDNHLKLNKKIKDLDKVRDQLISLKEKTEKECWRQWKVNLSHDFPSLKIIDKIDLPVPYLGVKVDYSGNPFSIIIEKNGEECIYGICIKDASEYIFEDIREFVNPIISGAFQNGTWYDFQKTTFQNGYSCLKSLVKEVIKNRS